MVAPGSKLHGPVLLVILLIALSSEASAAEPGLVFSVKTWDGEYTSKDIPGGVETTPVVGTIYTVNADGTGLTKVTDAPGSNSPDWGTHPPVG